MAPNRKQLNLLASSLADLDLVQVQAKYLPLTHPLEQAQQSIKETAPTPAVVTESASYWDWPADVPAEEEEPKDLFSASALEANLIKDSQRPVSADIIRATEVDVDYWDERVEEPQAATTKPQHDAYWSWPADPQEARIEAILKDEATRQLLSSKRIVEHLVKTRSSSGPSNLKPESDSYWTWESPPEVSEALDEAYSQAYWEWKSDDCDTAKVSTSEVIQQILKSETARELVSLARIEENLKRNTLPETCATQASSDDYWSWAPQADDGYWDWSAKPVAAGKGYWDW